MENTTVECRRNGSAQVEHVFEYETSSWPKAMSMARKDFINKHPKGEAVGKVEIENFNFKKQKQAVAT